MKKLLIILFTFLCVQSFSQVEDTTKYMKYPNSYGPQYNDIWATRVMRLPDTTGHRPQLGVPGALGRNPAGTEVFTWDGDSWVGIGGATGGIDSIFITNTDSIFIINTNNDTLFVGIDSSGIDSLFITNTDSIFIINGNDTIFVGTNDSPRDTAYLTGISGGCIVIDNDENRYKPNGGNRIIYVDTACLRDYFDNIYQNITNVFDSTDFTFFVDTISNSPPGGVASGYKVLVGTSPTGAFAGHPNEIAELVGATWTFTVPDSGDQLWVSNAAGASAYRFDGGAWVLLYMVINQNGNRFGVPVIIGSKDAQPVILKSNDLAALMIDSLRKIYINDFIGTDTSNNFIKVIDEATGKLGLGTFKELRAGTNITLDTDATGTTINATGGGGASTDSLKQVTLRNGSSPSYVNIGDSITATGTPSQSIIIYGTSITQGTGASNASKQYANITGVYAHANIINKGLAGTTMQSTGSAADSSMVDRIYTIPTFNSTLYKGIIFEYGTNDAPAFDDTTGFKTAFYRVIDTCIARGWPLNRIGIVGLGFFNSGSFPLSKITKYAIATRTIAATKGVGLGDLNRFLVEQGRLNNSFTYVDSLHPNDLGHGLFARAALNSLRFKHSTFFDVLGGSTASGFVQRQAGFIKIPTLRVLDSAGTTVADLLVGTSANNNIYFGSPNVLSTGVNNYSYGVGTFAANTTGGRNIAISTNALASNTTGTSNIAIGYSSQRFGTTATNNVSIGDGTLGSASLTGINNTAIGTLALAANAAGEENTAVGAGALQSNLNGIYNIGVGYNALVSNTSGNLNVALLGQDGNTTGGRNMSMGFWALRVANGTSNIGIGVEALKNTTGSNNVGMGDQAGVNNGAGSSNVIIGHNAAQTKVDADPATAINNSIYIGSGIFTGTTTPTNEIAIGAGITANGNNTTTIGTSSTTDTYFGGTKIHLGGVIWAVGSGSPEGVVTAPVGSFYSRTNGGAGTSWYVKESGSGNTGWVAK